MLKSIRATINDQKQIALPQPRGWSAVGGVFDLRSKYGATEELWFPEWEFDGNPYENPELYETLFPNMIKNWRNDFKNNFPFYFVQIAPYNI